MHAHMDNIYGTNFLGEFIMFIHKPVAVWFAKRRGFDLSRVSHTFPREIIQRFNRSQGSLLDVYVPTPKRKEIATCVRHKMQNHVKKYTHVDSSTSLEEVLLKVSIKVTKNVFE